jgi:hypothetical protein
MKIANPVTFFIMTQRLASKPQFVPFIFATSKLVAAAEGIEED